MADVFLSYGRPNLSVARRIADRLRSAGYSVWFDEKLPVHRAYAEAIEEQLEQSKAVVVLWSRDAVASQWVRSEADRARELGRLVQARIDDARLPMPFDQMQCADLTGSAGKSKTAAWQSVVDSIADLCGGESTPPQDRNRGAAGPDRRSLILTGGAAIALVAGGALLWRETRRPNPSPEAQLLLQKGLDALQQNDALDNELPPGAGAQAVALLTQATEALPDNATAWGGLAMAYAVRRRAAAPSDRAGFEQRSRAAAQRGLELDSKELRSLAALRMLEPVYRNWAKAERESKKALKLHPKFPIHLFLLSDVLGSVGRWREAAAISRRADRKKFLIPGADRKVVANLWAAGDLQGADEALDQAVERWPEHPQVWRTRIAYLMYTGRAEEALALLRSPDRPAAVSAELVSAATATATVLAGTGERSAAIHANLEFLKDNPPSALPVAQALAAMGDTGTAFSILDGYYFGEGPFASVSPPGGDADRQTAPLFMPPMRGLWSRAEFKTLLGRIGLEDYWRKSGTRPDFRS